MMGRPWWLYSNKRSPDGGHIRILGACYSWVNNAWGARWLHLWGVLYLGRWNDSKKWQWSLGSLRLVFTPAEYRVGHREKRQAEKDARRHIKKFHATQQGAGK